MLQPDKGYAVINNWEKILNNRRSVRACLRLRFKNNNEYFLKRKYVYRPTYWKINAGFYPTVSYNAYQGQFWWIKRKLINIKYHKLLAAVKEEATKFRSRRRILFNSTIRRRYCLLRDFLYLYNYFFSAIFVDLFYLLKSLQTRRQRVRYFLILSFTKNKLFVNLQNIYKKNYFFLSCGLFIRFFKKKKSFKKNKTVKLLIAKYVRKIYLICRIKNSTLVVRKNPLLLLEIINFFNAPIAHKFIDPVENRVIEETDRDYAWIKFLRFIFIENKDFSNNRKPQKGRIKRKILRKLVFENKIID